MHTKEQRRGSRLEKKSCTRTSEEENLSLSFIFDNVHQTCKFISIIREREKNKQRNDPNQRRKVNWNRLFRTPISNDCSLINNFKNIWSTHDDLICSNSSHSKENEQLQSINHRSNIFPIVSNLKTKVLCLGKSMQTLEIYFFIMTSRSHMIGNKTEIFGRFIGFFS